jgi:acyl dehydratase
MASHTLTARNSATSSENRIHDDEVARRYGFRGGLVPGVTLFAYLVPAIVADQGEPWLEGGFVDVRFAAPVYEGGVVTAACDGGVVELCDHEGTTCVAGTAWRARGGLLDRVLRSVPLPEVRPAASDDTLAIGTMLGSIEHEATVEAVERYLESIGDDAAWWRDRDVVHPGWLLLDANHVLARNVRLGPWIHAASRVRLLRTVPFGAALETRAEVVDAYDRKGHRFVDLDVVTLVRATPDAGARSVAAMAVRHTAIWQLRGAPPA